MTNTSAELFKKELEEWHKQNEENRNFSEWMMQRTESEHELIIEFLNLFMKCSPMPTWTHMSE